MIAKSSLLTFGVDLGRTPGFRHLLRSALALMLTLLPVQAQQPQDANASAKPSEQAYGEPKPGPHLLQAQELIGGRVYLEATKELELHLRDNPDDIAARALLANTQFELRDYKRAATNFAGILQKLPSDTYAADMFQQSLTHWERALDRNDPNELIEYARALNTANKHAEASNAYRQALAIRPDPAATLEFARSLSWAKEYEESIRQFQEYLKLRPDDRSVQRELAQQYTNHESYPEAIAAWQALVASNPTDLEARLGLATALAWSDDLEGAETQLEMLLQEAPQQKDALFLLAEVRRWKGRHLEAYDLYQQVLNIDPTHQQALEQRAALAGSSQLRIQQHQVWLTTHPDDQEVRRKLIDALTEAELFSDALNEVDYLLLAEPNDAGVRQLREEILAARKTAVQARIDQASQALEQSPDDDELLRQLGDDLALLDQYQEAAKLYERYVALRPEDPKALLTMARYMAWSEQYDKAISAFQSYLDQHPTDLPVRIEKARVLTWAGEIEAAESDLTGILADNPSNVEAMVQLGHVYEYLGDIPKARSIYLQAQAIQPQSSTVIQALDQLKEAEETRHAAQSVSGLKSMLEQEPLNHPVRLSLARRLASERQWKEAAAEYGRYLYAVPSQQAVRLEYARLLSWMQQYQDAAEQYLEYLQSSPFDQSARLELASVHISEQNLPAAMGQLNEIVAQDPAHSEARWMRASVFQWAEMWEEAVREYELIYQIDPRYEVALQKIKEIELTSPLFLERYQRKLDLDPEDIDTRYRYANLLLRREDYSEAANQLKILQKQGVNDPYLDNLLEAADKRQAEHARMDVRRARQLLLEDPENSAAELRLARARVQSGETDRALVHYQRYLHDHPNDFKVRQEFADVLSWSGKIGPAVENYRLVMQADPEDTQVRQKLYQVMSWSQGSLPVAIESTEQLVREAPYDPDLRAALGTLYRFSGKQGQAILNYEEALALDPTNETALNGLIETRRQLRPQINTGIRGIQDEYTDFTLFNFYARPRFFSGNGRWTVLPIYNYYTFDQDELLVQARLDPSDPYAPRIHAHEGGLGAHYEFNERLVGEAAGSVVQYSEDVGTGAKALAKLGYWMRPSVYGAVGYRHQDIVYEVNTMESLLNDRIESDDLLLEAAVHGWSRHPDSSWNRVHLTGNAMMGEFSDDNSRFRGRARLLYDLQRNPKIAVGPAINHNSFSEVRPQYYSPSSYTEYGGVLVSEGPIFPKLSYTMEGGVFYVDQSSDFVYSVQGGLTYNFTDNFHLGAFAGYATTSTSIPDKEEYATTNYTVDLWYRF